MAKIVTQTYELYDPKKHSVRSRLIASSDGLRYNDIYVDNRIIKSLGLNVNDRVVVMYAAEGEVSHAS